MQPEDQKKPVIEAVLFDYGLVLTGPPDPAAWAEMQHLLALDEATFSHAYWKHRSDYDRGTLNGRGYWSAIGQDVGHVLAAPQIDGLIAADTVLWTQLNQPMVDWALRLQAAGTRTGILSNLGDEMMHGVLAALPWMAGFDHLTFSHHLLLIKPEAAIYQHAASGLCVPAERILFVDDREENIAGAIAAGMQAIRYETQPAFEQALAAMGATELWTTGNLNV
ncbi:HAD family hydrolase [Granulicella tundricola]|uniref:HAD-superfamily hydrolase, subfamily IA, variant 3 n=1 Tax=Granulicella tundricola (strain ATCC BAA-1859 / DSM 23138 / MP5ACTX9) TaxID=1198114 RepID=E8WX15_GRATM|nr:HAD family phosphatase [Granulicella tundricola]ADW68576.1 HAD-superfamily hydrolase, subfamily IA, variant 3 [Granulicella tundricola MP5ACTX9]